MGKINGKVIFIVVWLLVIGLLVYSRFTNLGWGLPYPMHPDERNMANAIQNLNCKISNFLPIESGSKQITNFKQLISNCLNPHFFAYGQLPLYLGYVIVFLLKFFDGDLGTSIGFQEAAISLRLVSAVASILNVFVLIKIVDLISNIKNKKILIILIATFSPFFIQFSHFGTTESLLMLFYSLIVYLSMRLLESRTTDAVVWLGLVSGLAVATKVSSIVFIVVPLISILSSLRSWDRYKNLIKFGTLTIIFMILFSPHNLINFHDFFSSIKYESDVATGKALVFYTRQFFNTVPVWFQLTKIFPYALGWPVFILGTLGFLGLLWKDKKINLLRFSFLVYFLPNAFLFAKWARFMAPVFPLMVMFAVLFLLKIKAINIIKIIIVIIAILPGIAYLSVYKKPDVRFQASEWIYKNIPNGSFLLFETANVVDIPIMDQRIKIKDQKVFEKNYQTVSFNFYDLDESLRLQSELKDHLEKANYIFVPSRRIFANHPKQKYPILNQYYSDLFSEKLGFKKVAEFSAGLNDENSEETWTVFDHPVIRIYKKTSL